MNDPKYILAEGAQVREEDFGLLFYNMHGPRLYFLKSGNLLSEEFFHGLVSLKNWVEKNNPMSEDITRRINALKKPLKKLVERGVIIEC